MNAKRISNHVKNNVHETNNFSELKKLLRQYEDKIRHLEAEKLREHNQGEELLSMVKRLMAQKKELIDKLSLLDNSENTGLNNHEKKVIAETLEFHQQLDGIIKKSYSRSEDSEATRENSKSEIEPSKLPQCDSVDIFRFQNIKLINRVLQLQKSLKRRDDKSKKSSDLLSGLLQEPSCLFKLSDRVLKLLKQKLVSSVEGIDEQLISRKLAKRLRHSLQRSEVDIEKKFEDFELLKEFSLKDSSSGDEAYLGKRSNFSKGVLKNESIEAILRGACLPSTVEYNDTCLPSAIKMSLEMIQQSDSKEIDLVGEEIDFNTSALDKAEAEVEIMKVKQAFKVKLQKSKSNKKAREHRAMIDLSKEKKFEKEIKIDFSEDDMCEEIDDPSKHVTAERLSLELGDPQTGSHSPYASDSASSQLSKEIFKLEREPLIEKKNDTETSSIAHFASPKSSVYYFTSKKNEYEFSFDRSTIQVEKNLGERLLMSTIQKSFEKENNFRLQR